MAQHKSTGGKDRLCSSSAKKGKEQIMKATFEKWQKEHEIEHQMLSWLQCDLDDKGTHMVSLCWSICRKYKANIQSLKNFRRDWITGLTNQRTSNLMDHTTSDVHKVTMAKLKVGHSRASGESVATSIRIKHLVSLMDNRM